MDVEPNVVLWASLQSQRLVFNSTELPSENVSDDTRMYLATFYGLVGAFGVLGNFWTIMTVSLQLYKPGCRKRHLLLYVLVLSVVDLLFVLFLPLVITDMLSPNWPFDRVLCKLLWSCDSPNKFLSTFLLVALSAHCYIAVCHPETYKQNFKKRRFALSIILVSAVISVVCMTPVYMYADVWVMGNYSDNNTFIVHMVKCLIYAPPNVAEIFTLYAFALGFGLTVVLQLCFYGLMLMRLVNHKRQMRQSRIHVSQITKSVLMLVTFYLFCWTPYWLMTLVTLFGNHMAQPSHSVSVVIHALPYLNAALNSTLYLRLTRTLRISDASRLFINRLRSRFSSAEVTLPLLLVNVKSTM